MRPLFALTGKSSIDYFVISHYHFDHMGTLTGQGGPEVLEQVELPLLPPGPGEVRLDVQATGAGGTDVTMRRGRYSFAPPYPFVPGYEVLGDIEAVGPGVHGVAVGQRVAALTVHGGYAEKIVLPASAVVPVPDGLDPAKAVALHSNRLAEVIRMRVGLSFMIQSAFGHNISQGKRTKPRLTEIRPE